MILTKSIKKKIEEYVAWEKSFDFEGWEEIDIFIDVKLSDAWIKARPGDAYKFEDLEFKNCVDSANGKWLEKQYPEEKYKIIVSLGQELERTEDELCEIILHELRHCLDYQSAVRDLAFEEYWSGNRFFINWSEYRAVSVSVRYNFFLKSKCSRENQFEILAGILGIWSADCVEGLMRSEDPKEKLYFLSRYIGASRAIRNLNAEYQIDSDAFHLWNMTPTYITEKYGYVFYIGNEWDDLQSCSLDAEPHTYYYGDLLNKMRN
jgi:hypothetical protein